jgi:succinate dehydrogenase flavin-adding protein (antitoxin of CptAB toxin-antitoxin module)
MLNKPIGLKSVRNFCSSVVPRFNIKLSEDFLTAKKQVFWRIRNIGQLELEFLLMKWYEKQDMNLDQLREFTAEVLEMENPEMNQYFVKFDQPTDNMSFTKQIQNAVLLDKTFYI